MNQKLLFEHNELLCPLCNLNVRSESELTDFCKLCGMFVVHKTIFVKRNGRKFVFCSDLCKHRFLKLGFRSFDLYRGENYGML